MGATSYITWAYITHIGECVLIEMNMVEECVTILGWNKNNLKNSLAPLIQ
jgi:hypothetical protein